MTTLAAVAFGLAAAGVVLVVLWPLLAADRTDAEDGAMRGSDLESLDAELEQTLRAIKEIGFDRESGHLSDADFQALDREERARAIELMRRMDGLAGPSARTPASDGDPAAKGHRSPY